MILQQLSDLIISVLCGNGVGVIRFGEPLRLWETLAGAGIQPVSYSLTHDLALQCRIPFCAIIRKP